MAYRQCVCCGIVIETPFWLCQSCEDEYGVTGRDYRYWPSHLRSIVNQAQKDEYRARRLGLVPFDDMVSAEADMDGALMVVPPQEYDMGGMADDLLAYAPYTDELANRAYRRANGIRERD